MTRAEQAQRLAGALLSTAERARGGFMSHATMKSHMASLWGTVDAKGLREDVLELVDPALVGVRPLSEQVIKW